MTHYHVTYLTTWLQCIRIFSNGWKHTLVSDFVTCITNLYSLTFIPDSLDHGIITDHLENTSVQHRLLMVLSVWEDNSCIQTKDIRVISRSKPRLELFGHISPSEDYCLFYLMDIGDGIVVCISFVFPSSSYGF